VNHYYKEEEAILITRHFYANALALMYGISLREKISGSDAHMVKQNNGQ